jgi:tetratricopeptide (TPR) repeat protein
MKSSPEFSALANEASAAFRDGTTEAAVQKYRQLLEADPTNESFLANLTALLFNSGRYAEAMDIARLHVQAAPGSVKALDNMVAILVTDPEAARYRNELQTMVAAYEARLRQDGADTEAQANLSALLSVFYPEFESRYRPVMISTVGGSGTYFTMHFFGYLERRMRSYSQDYNPVFQNVAYAVGCFVNLKMFKVTMHGSCPGFEEAYHGPYRAAWDAMAAEGQPEHLLPQLAASFDPQRNPRARLVHIYRNPIEWLITVYRQALRRGDVVDGPEALSAIAGGALAKRAVTQYFSFRVMAERFPEQVLLLRFEDLVGEPERTFQSMLTFFGTEPISPDLIRSSVRSASPQALTKMEDRTGLTSGPSAVKTHFDRDRDARNRVKVGAADRALLGGLYAELGLSPAELGIAAS